MTHRSTITTDVNRLDGPEVRNYRQEVREGVTITAYEIRQPGARDCTPVRLVRLSDAPAPAPDAEPTCRVTEPHRRPRSGSIVHTHAVRASAVGAWLHGRRRP